MESVTHITFNSQMETKIPSSFIHLLFIFGGPNSTYLGLTQLPYLKKMPNSGSPTTVKPSSLTQRDG